MSSYVKAVGAKVRRLRVQAGYSQAELAGAAGVSRQAVGALESGRHLPRVDTALALAAALGTTVERLLASDPQTAETVTGRSLPDGLPVRLGRVGDHLVGVPAPCRATGESLALPDAVIRNGVAQLFEDADADGFVLVGCDPALAMVAALGPVGPGRVLVVPGSTAVARRALVEGRAHAALVHGSQAEDSAGAGVQRLRLASWRTGLAAPAGATTALDEALEGRGTVIQREPGAAAQTAYLRALEERGAAPPPASTLASGHFDAARRATETGAAAVTIEPVARFLGLEFRALEHHLVEIWVAGHALDHPGARALGDVLTSGGFRSRIRSFAGYELEGVA